MVRQVKSCSLIISMIKSDSSNHKSLFSRWQSHKDKVTVGVENMLFIDYLWDSLPLTCLTLIPAWLSNHIYHKVWDEITYPFSNFDGAAMEVCEWLSNATSYYTGHVIIYPCWDWNQIMLVKGATEICGAGYILFSEINVYRTQIQFNILAAESCGSYLKSITFEPVL